MTVSEPAAGAQRNPLATGPGRLLVVVYAVFAVSASARSGYQLATRASQAPVAYTLSLFSAVVYLVATVALTRAGYRWWRVAVAAVLVEAVGVISVGSWTMRNPQALGDATVWSDFGSGYGYVPLVLPLLGLVWLWSRRPVTSNA
ncbi:MAG: hypothetical protein CSA58_11025 [Micrococcales bacterium]|nr:MAG: hypothetical protein CSB46_00675 [Micrococcales bacterium]PIE26150.1 MAG: hypothetical protein CSA58_11025 [Micrococcales bacterium]